MGMSFVTLGLAGEFGPQGVAVNALWPRTLIGTDALNMIPGVSRGNGRRPEILAAAAHAILVRPAAGFSGHFLIDDDVLPEAGGPDLPPYSSYERRVGEECVSRVRSRWSPCVETIKDKQLRRRFTNNTP